MFPVTMLQSPKVLSIDPEIGQEDHGWYFTFTGKSGTEYDFIVGQYGDEGWLGCFERSLGFIKSILGFRKKSKILQDDLMAFNQVFKESERISDVKWHYQEDFMKGNEDAYSNTP